MARSENVEKFLCRMKNFFRDPRAARDVPRGVLWALPGADSFDPFDPYTDPAWLQFWNERVRNGHQAQFQRQA